MDYQAVHSQGSGMPMASQQGSCLFQAPPPRKVHCLPAPFTRTDGGRYHRLVVAYGQSRPSPQ